MFETTLMGVGVVLVVAFIVKWGLDYKAHKLALDNTEFTIATMLLLFVFVPLTSWLGVQFAITNQLTFHENWNGYERRADFETHVCYRDDPFCKHTYKGDPYQYIWYTTEQVCTGTGKDRTCTPQPRRHEETRYHDIPYCAEEWTFTVQTSLGPYVVADRNCPTDADDHRFRLWVSVPDYIPSGVPVFWTQAKARLDAGKPGPVTARKDYINYILASQSSILKNYATDMESYAKGGLLPALSESPVHDFYFVDRVFFVGTHPSGDWQSALARFDAAFGSELQGDLYVVLIDAKVVADPDNYINSLIAYWQSPKFGADALSKNGFVIVVGVKDNTVAWARAKTGMPEGNEALLVDLQYGLKGARVDPQLLLGDPQVNASTGAWTHTQGAIEGILYGKDRFQRVHMGGAKDDKSAGYAYLARELQPTLWEEVAILTVIAFLSVLVWCVGLPAYDQWRQRLSLR
jgi:hypothetical protein